MSVISVALCGLRLLRIFVMQFVTWLLKENVTYSIFHLSNKPHK